MFRSNFSFKHRESEETPASQSKLTSRIRRWTSKDSSSLTISPSQDGDVSPAASRPASAVSCTESTVSTEARAEEQQPRTKSTADAGSLGLNVLYAPAAGEHRADIIFVHGLGGTSRYTWTKNKEPHLFWPLKFLPLEPDIAQARVLTFGYNANFSRRGSESISILDFAKDLLFELKYATDDEKRSLSMGTVPLIFVVHSMGGLIIKEAYLHGQNDPEYETIIKAIYGITFLATPHRGTNLASLLNTILTSTFFSNSKQYITDLNQNSVTLQKLNDQFRHIASKLDIVSFYETQPTPIGLLTSAVMILEKDTSVLGYPGEVSRSLNADHHNVCKYESPLDPNYVIVRNVLKSFVSKIITKSTASDPSDSVCRRSPSDLKSSLAIAGTPNADYMFFRDQWAEDTGNWIFQHHAFLEWSNTTSTKDGTRLLLLHGGPGSGKSVLSSFIVNELVQRGLCCQYYFVRASDRKKRGLSHLLRSIAYQLAIIVPSFLEKALEVVDEGIGLETADSRTVWERLFKSLLPHLTALPKPLYWILDGIDEATDPRAIVKLFADTSLSSMNLRVLLVSRGTSEILAAFDKIPQGLCPSLLNIEGQSDDMRRYIRQELRMAASAEYQHVLVEQVLKRSQNNFLWVRLAVEKLNACHTQSDVDEALARLPAGMQALYDRMAAKIASYENATEKHLAKSILECATVSMRMLSLTELTKALGEDMSSILDVERTVRDLTAGFVVADNDANVAMIHQTAREYLFDTSRDQPFAIHQGVAHGEMFLSCMRCLTAIGLRTKIQAQQTPDFVDYAATSWSKHLIESIQHSTVAADNLLKFLNGPWVLTWIYYLSGTNQLGALVQSGRHLSTYFAKHKTPKTDLYLSGGTMLKQTLMEGWATDLLKLVGKYGNVLRHDPESIFKLVPAFCPASSSIYQIFGKTEFRTLSISGLSSDKWNDSLARIALETDANAAALLAVGGRIAVLAALGTVVKVYIFDSSTFEAIPHSPIIHGERVLRMELNHTATQIATYGYRTTKVWDLASGTCTVLAANQIGQRPLTMAFTNDSTHLLLGTEDRCLKSLDIAQSQPSWGLVAELEEEEIDGLYLNAPSLMALNRDANLIAVASRGHPMSAWEVDGPSLIGHCWRMREEVTFGQVIDAAWNPHYPEIFGLYIEGVLFRWRPYDDEREEITVRASRLSMSRDGNLLATGDGRGTVKVFATADLGLIYQLASEETVRGLAFSPDNRRLYDIRGQYANVWEPNALLKFFEQREKEADSSSDTDSVALKSSIATAYRSERIDSVTALAPSPDGRYYAYGTDQGDLQVFDVRSGKSSCVYKVKSFFSIDQIAWSVDGRLLALCFSGRRLAVLSTAAAKDEADEDILEASVLAEATLKTGSENVAISQLLFDADARNLAVITASAIQLFSLDNLDFTHSLPLDSAEQATWMSHPNDQGLLLGVSSEAVTVINWELIEQQKLRLSWAAPITEPIAPSNDPATTAAVRDPRTPSLLAATDHLEHTVDRVIISQTRNKQLLVQLSLRATNSRRKRFVSLDTSTLLQSPLPARGHETTQPQNEDGQPISSLVQVLHPTDFLPSEIADEVFLILAFLPRDRLVFLSKHYAVRTWQVPSGALTTGITNRSLSPSSSSSSLNRPPSTAPPIVRPVATRYLPLPQERPPQSGPPRNNIDARYPSPSGTSLDIHSGHTRSHSIDAGNSRSFSPASAASGAGGRGKKAAVPSTKTLFYLPADWISQEGLAQCVIWAKEKALLCPRNGEVAVVRCSGLG